MFGIECSFLEKENQCSNANVHTLNGVVNYAICSCCRFCDGKLIENPGNCFKNLILSVGVSPEPNCTCESVRMLMNQWGPIGCREHISEICESIYAEYDKWKIGKRGLIFQQATIAAKLMAIGIIVNPLDPIRSLVLESIKRAESAKPP